MVLMAFLTSQSRIQILIHRWAPRTTVSGQGCFEDNLYLSRSLVPSVAQANTTGKTMKNWKKKPLKQWRIKNTQRIFTTVKPNFNSKHLIMPVTHSSTFCLSQNVEQRTRPCWMLNLFNDSTDRLYNFCSRSCNLCLTMTVNLSHSLSSNNC